MSIDLLDKLRAAAARAAPFAASGIVPGATVIDDVAGPGEVAIGGSRVLMFGSSDYLGLAVDPGVVAAAKAALDRYGTGTTGSRIANGTLALHAALERDFARQFDKRQSVVFTTGYQANLAIVCGLCGSGDYVLLDADAHASLWDAARLSGATVIPFRHNSPENLDAKLARLDDGRGRALVVIEGLYSIHADVAPIGRMLDVCRRRAAYLLVDEAHAFGVFGPRGLGSAEAQGVLDDVDFVAGTFSKALGGVGGFCVSNHDALRGLPFLARAYMFTASGTPATIAGASAALNILSRDAALRDRVWTNIRRIRAGLERLGFTIGATEGPIVPIYMGDGLRTVGVWQNLVRAGVYVNLVVPPACPPDACLFRLSVSARHTDAQIDRALEVFAASAGHLDPASLAVPRGR